MKMLIFSKMLWKKYFTFPVNYLTTFIIPIAYIFLFVFLYQSANEGNIKNKIDIGTIILGSWPTLILINLPIMIGNYRIASLYKYFPIMNLSRTKFLGSIFLQYFIIFFIVFNLQYLIYLGIFPGTFEALDYLILLIISFFTFGLIFIFSITLSLSSIKERKNVYFISLIYFLITILTAGVLIPVSTLDNNYFINNGVDSWIKWIQYFTPIGWGVRLYSVYTLPELWNYSDYLMLASMIIQISLLCFINYKKFVFKS